MFGPSCHIFSVKQSAHKAGIGSVQRIGVQQCSLCDLRLFFVTPFPLDQTSSVKVTQQN